MDPSVLDKAKDWLNQLDEQLKEEFQADSIKGSGNYFYRIESEIKSRPPEMFDAITVALGDWLWSWDVRKSLTAVVMIGRLELVHYTPDLEKIREQIRSFISPWPANRLSLVESTLKRLQRVAREESELVDQA